MRSDRLEGKKMLWLVLAAALVLLAAILPAAGESVSGPGKPRSELSHGD